MGNETAVSRKIRHIFQLIEKLAYGQKLYAQDENLQYELFGESSTEKVERSLRRYLETIYELYAAKLFISKEAKAFSDRKVTVYKIVGKKDILDVLKFFLDNNNDLTWVIEMLHTQDPSLLSGNEDEFVKTTLKKKLNEDKDIFLFASQPFEEFNQEEKDIFSNLKRAVKYHEYRTIYTKGNESSPIKDVKCLKMIYSQNNWYIAFEAKEEKLKLSRIKFITRVENGGRFPNTNIVLQKYQDYFCNFENPMTLSNTKKNLAILKASPEIAKYFKADMKPHFKSQKYIKTHHNESIEFSVRYTQPKEILPFVKKWMPEMDILSPASLKEVLKHDMELYMKRLT